MHYPNALYQWLKPQHWSKQVSRYKRIDIKGKGNSVEIAGNTQLHNLKLTIRGDNNSVWIGEHCIIGGEFELVGDGNQLVIGHHTNIESLLLVHGGKTVRIGAGCGIARGSQIRTSDNHGLFIKGHRINPDQDIEIGNGVWLAFNVMVLKGATIGDHAVISTGAVVSGQIPANCVATGVPARVVLSDVDGEASW